MGKSIVSSERHACRVRIHTDRAVRVQLPELRDANIKAASGFEPEMEVLQTSALPLGHAAVYISKCPGYSEAEVDKKKRETGFEPATSTLARWCSSQLSYSRISSANIGPKEMLSTVLAPMLIPPCECNYPWDRPRDQP